MAQGYSEEEIRDRLRREKKLDTAVSTDRQAAKRKGAARPFGRVCVVADRGMISDATIAGLEKRKLEYILGVHFLLRTSVTGDVGRFKAVGRRVAAQHSRSTAGRTRSGNRLTRKMRSANIRARTRKRWGRGGHAHVPAVVGHPHGHNKEGQAAAKERPWT